MIEIDRLTRFTIGNLKSIFQKAKEAKRQIAALPEEKRRKFTPQLLEEILRGEATIQGIKYTIIAETDPDFQIIAFRFMCCYDGKNRIQRAALQYEPSNLGLNPIPYFVCPYTGRRCRNIYTDGKVFISRWGFNHTYSQRNRSKKWRELDKILRSTKEPERKYRKTHYRNKITPYGKKLFHYYMNPPKVEDVERIFTPKPMGRPRTAKGAARKASLFLE